MSIPSRLLLLFSACLCVLATSSLQAAADALRITEFMASNNSHLADKNGEFTDWIEIWNPTGETVDLTGLFLTDDEGESKWSIPSGTLAPSEYIVIHASGEDDVIEGQLHTNFRLGRSGGYLALLDKDGTTVIDAYTAYPSQQTDVSYGRDASGDLVFFQNPTPSSKNGSGLLGFLGDTQFSHDRGFYEEAFDLEITTAVEDAEILYTVDGREPSRGNVFTGSIGETYAGPINITTTTTVRAMAFKAGFEPTNVDTQTYIFIDDVALQPADPEGWPDDWGRGDVPGQIPADYEMDPRVVENTLPGYSIREALLDIPTLSVVMAPDDFLGESDGIYSHTNPGNRADFERACSLELIYPDGRKGFQENCEIEIHGNASRRPARMQKHSFRVSFKSVYGVSSLRFPFFPDTQIADYNKIVLRACFTDSWGLVSWGAGRYRPNDSQYIRDVWMKESMRDMGHESMRSTFMHLYVNGLYWGLFNPSEKMEAEALVTSLGGEKEDYDVIADFGGALDGSTADWNALHAASRRDLTDEANYQQLQELVDLENFADYMLLHFFADAEDWPHHNGHAMRNRGANQPFKFYVWDQEIVLDNFSLRRYDASNAGTPGALFQSLRKSEEFLTIFADRVQKHLFNGGALDVKPAQDRYMRLANIIDKAIVAESARWGDTQMTTSYAQRIDQPRDPNNVDDPAYPTAPHAPDIYFTREDSWVVERDNVVNHYIPATHDRSNSYAIMNELEDEGLLAPQEAPSFSQHGGIVPTGFMMVLNLPASANASTSKIYYTIDGSDPRVFGGAIADNAELFAVGSDGIPLTETVTIRARLQNKANPFKLGGEWSALVEAKFRVGEFGPVSDLVLSEIQYQPKAPSEAERAAGFVSRSHFEYVEFLNTGSKAIILQGLTFSDGIEFTFLAGGVEELGAGERILIVNNPEAMAMRYGTDLPIAGVFQRGTQLANNGETLTLQDNQGHVVMSVRYDDNNGWPETADGEGPSLVLANPTPGADFNDAKLWRASNSSAGSPGSADTTGTPNGNDSVYPAWRQRHFTASAADAIAGPLADPDRDRLVNVIEYAFNLDPNKPSAHPLAITHSATGIDLQYTPDPAATGLTIVVEKSVNLIDWTVDSGENAAASKASFRLRVRLEE